MKSISKILYVMLLWQCHYTIPSSIKPLPDQPDYRQTWKNIFAQIQEATDKEMLELPKNLPEGTFQNYHPDEIFITFQHKQRLLDATYGTEKRKFCLDTLTKQIQQTFLVEELVVAEAFATGIKKRNVETDQYNTANYYRSTRETYYPHVVMPMLQARIEQLDPTFKENHKERTKEITDQKNNDQVDSDQEDDDIVIIPEPSNEEELQMNSIIKASLPTVQERVHQSHNNSSHEESRPTKKANFTRWIKDVATFMNMMGGGSFDTHEESLNDE
ncbi:MAG: hypothetical protein CL947_01045 [Epsilonproteobacteria bacterium]|nr:hypothetical protein [Campylobacterota bacterium]|tara:strand:- start:1024 stop:1842 length:819 start_codon:yes stop_codon:yes gene_type:complete